MKTWIMAGLLALGGAGAAWAEALPAPVRDALKKEAALCRDMGGGPQGPGPAAVLAGDANGDGQPDYVIDRGEVGCNGATVSCGSGGCGLTLFLSGPKGVVRAWDGLGTAPKLGKGKLVHTTRQGPVTVRIKGTVTR
ncbi:hypothetical protein ACEYYB_00145 [Paracoccus sp. p4-l81]|uniref:hypothetical protein n=1 Tax=unclassified Paracoccus (in: a-proteobacteria) TaxID=2688777 RepID=UPI0035B758A7